MQSYKKRYIHKCGTPCLTPFNVAVPEEAGHYL